MLPKPLKLVHTYNMQHHTQDDLPPRLTLNDIHERQSEGDMMMIWGGDLEYFATRGKELGVIVGVENFNISK